MRIDDSIRQAGGPDLKIESNTETVPEAASATVDVSLTHGLRTIRLLNANDDLIAITSIFVASEGAEGALAASALATLDDTRFVQCNTRTDLTIDALQQALYVVTLSPDIYALSCQQYGRFEQALLDLEAFQALVQRVETRIGSGMTPAEAIDPDTFPTLFDEAARLRSTALADARIDLDDRDIPESDEDKNRDEPPRLGVVPETGFDPRSPSGYGAMVYNATRMHYAVLHVAPQPDGSMVVDQYEALGPVKLWKFWTDHTRATIDLSGKGVQSIVFLNGWEDPRELPPSTAVHGASVATRLQNAALVVRDFASLMDVACLAGASDPVLENFLDSGELMTRLQQIVVNSGSDSWSQHVQRAWSWFRDDVGDLLSSDVATPLKCSAKDAKLLKKGNKYVYAAFKGLEIANTTATLWSLFSFNDPYASWDAFVGPIRYGSFENPIATLESDGVRVTARAYGVPLKNVEARLWTGSGTARHVIETGNELDRVTYEQWWQPNLLPHYSGRPWFPERSFVLDETLEHSSHDGPMTVILCAIAGGTFDPNTVDDCATTAVTGSQPSPSIDATVATSNLPAGKWSVTVLYPSVLYGSDSYSQIGGAAPLDGNGSFTLDLSGVTPPPVPLTTINVPPGVTVDPSGVQGAGFSLITFDDANVNGTIDSGEDVRVLEDPSNTFGGGELDLKYVDRAHTITGTSSTTSGDPVTWSVDAAEGWGRTVYSTTGAGSEVKITYSNVLAGLTFVPDAGGSAALRLSSQAEDPVVSPLFVP